MILYPDIHSAKSSRAQCRFRRDFSAPECSHRAGCFGKPSYGSSLGNDYLSAFDKSELPLSCSTPLERGIPQMLRKIMQMLGKRNLRRLATTIWLAIAVSSSSTFAQSGIGAIQGTVQDSAGAVIPAASVHVVNQDTGVYADTKSNEVGFYSVPSLFTGNYTLTFSARGMKQYQTSIALQVAQTAVINPSLTPGSVTEQITVSGNAVQLATYDSPTISSVLENNRINQLPMNGRNLLTLTGLTTPGLEGGTQANGMNSAAIEYVQDGVPLANRNVGGPTRMPDPDSVQEVRVETANSSAQFATPATGILTTKSGTNELHGSLFETARNNYIGIAKARQDPANLKAPHLVRNEFGGSVGGPIIIPKLYNGKNKSFFFFAYERYSLRSSTSQLDTVPTVAMRNGDFSGLVNSAGQLQVLYDSQTTNPVTFQRQPFPNNNQIPMARLSPLAKTLYAITPLPTSSDDPMVSSNYTSASISNQTAPTITFRLDQNLNENNRVYLRYTSDNYSTLQLENYPTNNPASVAGGGLPANVTNLASTPTTVYSAALGYTHVFSSTFVSETVLSNEWEMDVNGQCCDINTNYEVPLGLPNNFGEQGFPEVGNNLFMYYEGTQDYYSGSQIITNVDENLSKTLGRHQLLFGARYRHERLGSSPDKSPDNVSFDSQATGQINPATGASYGQLPNTGNVNADFFLGGASSYTVNLNGLYEHFRDQEFDSYFQDNFHLDNRLTVNVGVRWEVHPSPTEKNNTNNGFDFKNKAIVLGQPIAKLIARGATTQAIITNLENLGAVFETPQEAGLPDSMIFNSDFTFSPRLGVAYRLFGEKYGTVLRGGFGRYIYPIPIRNTDTIEAANAPYRFAYTQSYSNANQSPDGLPNYLLRAPQTVVAGLNSSGVVNTGGINSILPGISETVQNPHYPPTYVTQGNVTVEQPLKGSSVLRLTWLYNHGTNLDQEDELNTHPSPYVYEEATGQIPPTGTYASVALGPYDQTLYNSLIEDDRNGYSNYNAFQANYQRLYKKGYAFQIFYVYARALRMGGNAARDSIIYPIADYAPGLAPVSTENVLPWTTPKALNRFQNYIIDTSIPEHHISFNGIVDIPIGRGKRFLGGVNRFVDELIGGYQIAGDGNVLSEYFQPYTGNYGPTNPLQVYKHSHKINDCRSGVCHPSYLWFNGFLSPLVINAAKNGVSGVPADYLPYQTPIDMVQGNANFLTNNVPVTLANGQTITTGYSPGPGLNPYSRTFLHGPYNYTADLSIFKVFPITERVNLRVNMDAFNAFNIQGYNNPNSTDGTESLLSSHNTPRQVQFTVRLNF